MTQFKDKAQKQPENINAGLFFYPVLQAADILLYKASRVPIGADQLQHLELARVIVRRFNSRYGETFPEPQPQLPTVPKILGLDGQAKMSKSLGNTIALRDAPDVIRAKLATAVTDPARQRRKDPGNPDVCNLHTLHTLFSTPEAVARVRAGCGSAGIGCLECKRWLADTVVEALAPIRERALALSARPEEVRELLAGGAHQASVLARETLAEVRARLGLRQAV
jgi:tryptophanyl-tRNA synthetase